MKQDTEHLDWNNVLRGFKEAVEVLSFAEAENIAKHSQPDEDQYASVFDGHTIKMMDDIIAAILDIRMPAWRSGGAMLSTNDTWLWRVVPGKEGIDRELKRIASSGVTINTIKSPRPQDDDA